MKEKYIIFTTLGLLLISFIFLSATERNQANIDTKDIWMIYFANPKDNTLDFSIANHSNQTDFHFKVISDKTTLQESDIRIPNGQTKNIPITIADTQGKKITISVSAKDNTKEIYKSF